MFKGTRQPPLWKPNDAAQSLIRRKQTGLGGFGDGVKCGCWLLEEGRSERLKLAVEFDIVEGRIWKWMANEVPG